MKALTSTKARQQKYNAKVCYLDTEKMKDVLLADVDKNNPNIVKFDSKWELVVYRILREFFPEHCIHHHYPVRLKDATPNFKLLDWRCDFAVFDGRGNLLHLIEAKGVSTRDFKLKMLMLDSYNSAMFNCLLVVSKTEERIISSAPNFRSINLRTLRVKMEVSSSRLHGNKSLNQP